MGPQEEPLSISAEHKERRIIYGVELIKKIRPEYLNNKTHYIIHNFDEFRFKKDSQLLNENFSDYRTRILENRKMVPSADNRNTASYYLFCMSRYTMLKEVIETNPFNSTHFCWINFCIERMGFKNIIRLSEGLSVNRDKFSTCYIDYISESMVNNLDEYYRLYKSREKLMNDNSYYCSVCQERRVASKRCNIVTWPKHLIIVLKRFNHNGRGKSHKIDKEIQVPLLWRHNYRLKGIVYHSGSVFGGHYIYVGYNNNKWLMFDDNYISEIHENHLTQYLNYGYIYYYEMA